MKIVFVVGAGPAGMFAAQKIAQGGHEVVIMNRDIKPGGLAEYGIYPTKDKMKIGLRKQFAKVLGLPNVHYFGHVPVSSQSQVSIADLQQFGPSAIVFAIGAQGTKKLGLPGEEVRGVYAAKDFVYSYNLLPPFTSHDFSTGKRVAIVGMGNVMVDIARWLLIDDPLHTAEEVIIVARRGPFEAKFDNKEFKEIEMFLDRDAFQTHLAAHPVTALAILAEMSRRLRHADEVIGDLALLDVYARVARTVRDLAQKQGEPVDGGLLIKERPTQQEIAGLIGTSRETVSRALNDFTRRGQLEMNGKQILVRYSFLHQAARSEEA